ncbi:NAD(P)H-quinone oxidoreductase [Opitutus terrae]|uniref:NAD(P)H quinone oxidoreductase, PIG3 family n=1 Tax=Opitutus terrae (strain DSM 11246 / JCM 15787 / PB90-1) TaxID=452637 RepID=B1ZN92_OPITP|nr:NAD(P)H-quinone oxidoreductase [Opitutus terrae]ACB73461.1 NAD(P)H quinone oxidoreductase, PIG3 family [Opitutus terrae PB90-1]
MKAVVISQPGAPEVLTVAERPTPTIGDEDVLIRVQAAGVNRADVIQRKGHYPAPAGVAADIPGLEVAGLVEACGAKVTRWQVGDPVCALLAGGGYAEFVAVDAGHCLPVPKGWSFTDAAALPEALFTVWSNVFQRGRLQRGETFLVHGGTSGIGMAAVQLAKAQGARVFATAGTDEKCRACEVVGAERCINYRTEDFAAALKDEGVDVILDMIGGDYVAKNLKLLRPEGRLVFINAAKGAKVEVNLLQVMSQRLTITGSTLRSRERTFKAALAAEIELEVWPLLASGQFRANVFKVFALADAAEAHRLMESSQHIGKLVLAL